MHLHGVRRAEPPEAREYLKIFDETSIETCNHLKILMEILPFFENL